MTASVESPDVGLMSLPMDDDVVWYDPDGHQIQLYYPRETDAEEVARVLAHEYRHAVICELVGFDAAAALDNIEAEDCHLTDDWWSMDAVPPLDFLEVADVGGGTDD